MYCLEYIIIIIIIHEEYCLTIFIVIMHMGLDYFSDKIDFVFYLYCTIPTN